MEDNVQLEDWPDGWRRDGWSEGWCPWCGRYGALYAHDSAVDPLCGTAVYRGRDVNCMWYSHIEKKIDTAATYTKMALLKRYGRHPPFKKLADNIPSFWTDIAGLAANPEDTYFEPANEKNR